MLTYEDSPAFTLMEREVLYGVRVLAGYPNGDGDGVINDGGSFSNMIGIALARYKKFSDTKDGGNAIVGKELVFYVSDDAHYSYRKGALVEGTYIDSILVSFELSVNL
jgi:glutamate/tyrosine decarboxylase-like PLP-dependent enzyme